MFDRIPLVAVAAALSALIAGAGVWKYQSARIDAIQGRFDAFVTSTRIAGEKAAQEATERIRKDREIKRKADDEYKTHVAALNADIDSLRNARARRSYVPPTPANTGHPGRTCFDRAELEQAIQRLDGRVSGIVAEGDSSRIALDIAKRWATAH